MIVSFANLKGGTGKTTTVVNLGTALANGAFKVLIIDLVPQGDATFSLGIRTSVHGYNLTDALVRGRKLEKAIQETDVSGLFVVPSDRGLINTDLELAPLKGRERALANSIASYMQRDFDFVLLDCPSAINLLLVNALIASDFLLVPTTPTFLSVRGLKEILRVQEELKRNMNCGLKFLGILLNMVDYRMNATETIIGELRSSFGKKVLNTTIERTGTLAECPASHMSILQMRPGSPAARSFLRLKDEFVSRLKHEDRVEDVIDQKSLTKFLQTESEHLEI